MNSPAQSGARSVRVVIVDDHTIFRSGLKADLDERMDVVGEAGTVEQAIAVIAETRPEVVLLDVHLPGGLGGGGREVIAGSAALLKTTSFLALSVSDAAEDVVAVIRAGARGYVTKTISGAEISDAVIRVADGDAVFSPRLAGFVLDAFGTAPADIADDELDKLSARELEVMRLIARGVQLQGGGQGALHLHQDGGNPRLRSPPQAPAVKPPRAHQVGCRAPPPLTPPGRSPTSHPCFPNPLPHPTP
ncbi:response regulator transcription factor [Paenarthrobacter ureafaciens]